MNNMTVSEVLDAFVPRWHIIRVMHFPETETYAEVLYEGVAHCEDIPDDVGKRIVSSVFALDRVLCIHVYKEEA